MKPQRNDANIRLEAIQGNRFGNNINVSGCNSSNICIGVSNECLLRLLDIIDSQRKTIECLIEKLNKQ